MKVIRDVRRQGGLNEVVEFFAFLCAARGLESKLMAETLMSRDFGSESSWPSALLRHSHAGCYILVSCLGTAGGSGWKTSQRRSGCEKVKLGSLWSRELGHPAGYTLCQYVPGERS